MALVPCNSEVLLTSFADNVFPGTYYGKYVLRRDALFSSLHGHPAHLFTVRCWLFAYYPEYCSRHKSIVIFIKASLCISGTVLSTYNVLTHFIFITTLLDRDG